MNDPSTIEINFDEMLEWLLRHKTETGKSWPALGKASGIPGGTLSALTSPNFNGNRENMAKRIFAYRQKVMSQGERAKIALRRPEFVSTPTAQRLQFLMEWAQGGRITVATLGPGTGKTMAAENYKAAIGETVWIATMSPSTRSLTAMVSEIMKAMGMANASGWRAQRSQEVLNHVRDRGALLIVDEANHLELEALEQLRYLHDVGNLGICLLGNEELHERIRGGARGHAYGRLSSRIANWFVQNLPTRDDIEAYLDSLAQMEPALDEPHIRKPLVDVALSPGHGGLRELYQTLELAHMLAISAEETLQLEHVRTAIGSRTTRVQVKA